MTSVLEKSSKIPNPKTLDKSKNASLVTKKKKKNYDSFASFIYKTLKIIHPEVGITNKGMKVMDSFVTDIFQRIAVEAGKLARYNKKHTITAREIQTAVRLILVGELSTHAISQGTKAIIKYKSTLSQ